MLDVDYHSGDGSENLFAKHFQGNEKLKLLNVVAAGWSEGGGDSREAWPGNRHTLCNKSVQNVQRIRVPASANAQELTSAFERALAWVKIIDPKYVVLSLGFDFLQGDQGAQGSLSHFEQLGQGLGALGCRVVSILEGGYRVAEMQDACCCYLKALTSVTKPKYGLARHTINARVVVNASDPVVPYRVKFVNLTAHKVIVGQ